MNKRELERSQRRLQKQQHELAVRAGLLMFHAGIGKVAAHEIAQSGPSVDGKKLAELVGTFLISGFREDQIAEWIFEGFERPFVAAPWLGKGYSPRQVRFLLNRMAALPRSEDIIQIASCIQQLPDPPEHVVLAMRAGASTLSNLTEWLTDLRTAPGTLEALTVLAAIADVPDPEGW